MKKKAKISTAAQALSDWQHQVGKAVKVDIDHLARLASLSLTNQEKKKFEKQLGETLEYVKRLEAINTKNVEPTSQVTGLENVVREDEASPSLSQEDVLSNAKSKLNGFFKVKAILGNE